MRDRISARAGVPRRAARGTAVGHFRRQLDPGAHPRPGRTLYHAKRGHRRRRRGPEPGASRGNASFHSGLPPHQAAPGDQVARPRRGTEAAPVRPAQADHAPVAEGPPCLQGQHLARPAPVPESRGHRLRAHHPGDRGPPPGRTPRPGGARSVQSSPLHDAHPLHHVEEDPLGDQRRPLPRQQRSLG